VSIVLEIIMRGTIKFKHKSTHLEKHPTWMGNKWVSAHRCDNKISPLQRHWLVNFLESEVVSNKQIQTEERILCEEHLEKTHSRGPDGRFIVRFPMKSENCWQLGCSEQMAIKRFKLLENKFRKQPQFRQKYVHFMREYSSLGHVQLVRDYEQNDKSSFLPASSCGYHGSKTSKLRVVLVLMDQHKFLA
jgi:hypothetical protein